MNVRETVLDGSMATASALTAVAQRLGDRAGVAGFMEEGLWRISVTARPGYDLDAVTCDVLSYLADQMIREQLQRETESVRALIMAQVFSRVNLICPDQDGMPPGSPANG